METHGLSGYPLKLPSTCKERMFDCHFCNAVFTSSSILLDHIKYEHSNLSLYGLSSKDCKDDVEGVVLIEADDIKKNFTSFLGSGNKFQTKKELGFCEEKRISPDIEKVFLDSELKSVPGNSNVAEVVYISDSDEMLDISSKYHCQSSLPDVDLDIVDEVGVEKKNVNSIMQEKADGKLSCNTTISSQATKKDNNNFCERGQLECGLSLGKEINYDYTTNVRINELTQLNRNTTKVSKSLFSMDLPYSKSSKNERYALFHGNADNGENEIKSKKTRNRGRNRTRKERNNKIIIANVPCNQDWIDFASRNDKSTIIFLDETVRKLDEIMNTSVSETNKHCVPRTSEMKEHSREVKLIQCEKEIEIVDPVVTDTRTNQNMVSVEEREDFNGDIICMENHSKESAPRESELFLEEYHPQSWKFLYLNELYTEKELNERISKSVAGNTDSIFNSQVDDVYTTEKDIFHENVNSNEIHEKTAAEEYDRSTPKNILGEDGDIHLRIEKVYHVDEWEGEEVVSEVHLHKTAENHSFQNSPLNGGNVMMPALEKDMEIASPNNDNLWSCEEIQEINSCEADWNSTNLNNSKILQESSTSLKNNYGDYTYVKRVSGLKPYKCSQCLFASKNKEHLVLHMQKCFKRRQRGRTRKKSECDGKSVKCFLCPSQLENNFKLVHHLFRVHADIVNSDSVRSEILSMIEVSEVNCFNSTYRNRIIENAMRHNVATSSNILSQMTNIDTEKRVICKGSSQILCSSKQKCIFCGQKLHHKFGKLHLRKCIKRLCEELQEHKERISSQTSPGHELSCPVCKKLFQSLWCLYEHLFTHTPFKPYECSFCKKGFWEISLRNHHIREKCRNRIITRKFEKPRVTEDCSNLYAAEDCDNVNNVHETSLYFRSYQGTKSLENYSGCKGKISACFTNSLGSQLNKEKINSPFENTLFPKSIINGYNNCINTDRQTDVGSSQDSKYVEKKGQNDFENHMPFAHEQLRCLYCLEVCDDKVSLKYHTLKCRPKSYEKSVDKTCSPNGNFDDDINKTPKHYRKLMEEFGPRTSTGDDTNTNNMSSGSHACSACGRVFRSYYHLYSHRLVVHNGNGSDYVTNRRDLKANRRQHICKTCGKIFSSRVLLSFHVNDCLLSKKRVKPFAITSSGKSTSNHRGEIVIHKCSKKGEPTDMLHDFEGFTKPYICVLCQMEFSDKFCFRLHKSKHKYKHKWSKSKGTFHLTVELQRIDDYW
ncbi:uncharacterized protein LOC135215591 [Macrobrachium nipponense]|uniref:uncharacterized protein LOC135215591 n=1 Tax=Macrobrachium nipponense TaxID=159736 RepID=UPI0030C7AAAA